MRPVDITERKASKEEENFQGYHGGLSKPTQPLLGTTDFERTYNAKLRDSTDTDLQKVAVRLKETKIILFYSYIKENVIQGGLV